MIKSKSKQPRTLSGGCISLFGLPFFIAGLITSGFYFSGYSDWWKSRDWVEVPCWIESAQLKVSHGEDSTTHQAQASYRYEYYGRSYYGDRVSFSKGSDNIGNFQENAHRELKKYLNHPKKNATHKPFRCYVNPDKPEESVIYRLFRWEMQAFMALFALTFPAIGAGLIVGGIIAVKAAKIESQLKANCPEQPWRWKSDWVETSMPVSNASWRKALHIYTIWSGLVVLTLIAVTAFSGSFQSDKKSLFLFGFVFLWCFPAWFSFRHFRQFLAVGSLRFQMANTPASPGGLLQGSILFGRPQTSRGNAELVLTCSKLITRNSSDGESTATEIIWSQAQTVPMNPLFQNADGFRLPISIPLPSDAPTSGISDDPKITHSWNLKLKVPGTVSGATFEVPVFHSENTPQHVTKPMTAETSIHEFAAVNLPVLLAARHIHADFDRNGIPSTISCPAARHRGITIFLIIFNLIWTGAAVFLVITNAPLLFRIVWPVSATAIWLIIIYQLLHSRKVSIHASGLDICNKIGPWIRTLRFEKSQIKGFSHDTNMTANNQFFYRVRMEVGFGKKKTLVDGITESHTAAALASRFEDWRKSPDSGS